ncbi:hypothetical protein CCHR01_09488 [Colletotrichum chrysophilum]|uniref:Fungal N-terminal domain-containing protein n=1 Tax=Colletotrichum chrysophilum TaxID=1836956 RepID=A0AAD9AGQ1_9PEZI|nr:hypothetical protein CCHR01_09488 [Colletotrichum chrysophilum]
MAEVLGTVVGVVSLGLQACSGIIKYLDGIKGHQDDIASTSRLCESLQRRLCLLEGIQDDIAAAANGAGFEIGEAISSVKTEFTNLSSFMDTVRLNEDPSKSFSDWLKDRKTRVTFPFRRDHLNHLQNYLGQADKALQAALQMQEIRMGINSVNALGSIENRLTKLNTCSSFKFDGILQHLTQTRHYLGALSNNMSRMTLDLEAFVPHVQEHMENTTIQMACLRSQVGDVLQVLTSPDVAIVLKRLLSKPDVLRSVCTEATLNRQGLGIRDSHEDIKRSVTGANNPFRCQCRSSIMRTQSVRRFGPARFTTKRYGHQVHMLDCPLAGISPSRKGWSFVISGKLSRLVLSAAIDIPMAASFGAGGFSLSTPLTMYCFRNNSPAWNTVEIIQKASITLESGDFSLVLQKGIDNLRWIFTTKKASPKDIHSSEGTLLHAACYPGVAVNIRSAERLKPLIQFLVAVGVPRNHPNSNGE